MSTDIKLTNETIIKSIDYDQVNIIKNIIKLHCPEGIECDVTYSKGVFYKNLQPPKFKFDIEPEVKGVAKSDCRDLPVKDESFSSIMFDPPFVASMPKKEATGIITKRFGYYKSVPHELWEMYWAAMKELNRVLKPGGTLIVKCQDTIDSGKQCFSHVELINYGIKLGLYPKDMFVLLAKIRIIGHNHHKQQHARKFHSYFLVFKKQPSKVEYKFVSEKKIKYKFLNGGKKDD